MDTPDPTASEPLRVEGVADADRAASDQSEGRVTSFEPEAPETDGVPETDGAPGQPVDGPRERTARALAGLDDLPLAEHAQVYQAVHTDLQAALGAIDHA